jgi:RNA polymerase-interacting CarD/CdnL/TRCF family regulator
VKTFDGIYWLSVFRTDVEYIRPITSKYQIKRALTIVRKSPEKLPENHSKRNKLIHEALNDPSLYPKARLIRDLSGKQKESKLNFTEEDALLKMKKQFLNEWSVVQNMDREVLEEKLDKALETSLEKLAETA